MYFHILGQSTLITVTVTTSLNKESLNSFVLNIYNQQNNCVLRRKAENTRRSLVASVSGHVFKFRKGNAPNTQDWCQQPHIMTMLSFIDLLSLICLYKNGIYGRKKILLHALEILTRRVSK